MVLNSIFNISLYLERCTMSCYCVGEHVSDEIRWKRDETKFASHRNWNSWKKVGYRVVVLWRVSFRRRSFASEKMAILYSLSHPPPPPPCSSSRYFLMISANNVFGWAALSYFFPPRSTCRLSTWWISCRLIRLARPSSGHEPMRLARLDLFLCLWNGIISACQFAILFTRGFTSSHLSRFVWSAWPNCGEKCVTSKKTRLTIGSNLTNEKISWDTKILNILESDHQSPNFRLLIRVTVTGW